MRFDREIVCDNCGKTSYIYKETYPIPDGWDHSCSCPFCHYEFFTISKKSRVDFVARKEKR